MNKIFSIFPVILFVGLMMSVASCSSELTNEPTERDTDGWHSAKIRFNVERAGFDKDGMATRAGDYTWNDGDVVFLLLTGKDGGKIQAYVRYDGTAKAWSEVMYEGYKSTLTCTTGRVAEAYYIKGVKDLSNTTISITDTTAIYVCTSGTYIYPADGDMIVSVLLKPLTGRIRFLGAADMSATINGVKTYTAFSRTTGEFVESTAAVSTAVTDSGYTPYIYCSFADESNPALTVTTDKIYKTVFDPSSPVLKIGRSGHLHLPTIENHSGWITIVISVTLNKESLSLYKGESETLTATVLPEDAPDRNVSWTSSDTSVATVDNNGKVTAVNYGTVTITATSVSDVSKKATCVVEVTIPVASVTLNKESLSLYKGESETLTVTVLPEDAYDRNVSWTSSDTSVATVDNNGKVTAVNKGIVTITATSVSDVSKKATCVVEVMSDKVFTVSGVTFRMKPVVGGTFQMGATPEQEDPYDNEKPVHSVTLSSYYIGETEVTQELWEAVMGYKPTSVGTQWSSSCGLGAQYPAYYVSWNDCQEFITKLNTLTGKTFRLPTEAEWEYAARGGNRSNGYQYSGSNTIGDVAWYLDNSSSKTHPVKTKQPNELRIYDMSGNVWEWCQDWYGSYSSSSQTNPTGPSSGSYRVIRGGGRNHYAWSCRSSYRYNYSPDYAFYNLGLRLVFSE